MDSLGDRPSHVEPPSPQHNEFSIEDARDERTAMDSGAQQVSRRPDLRTLFTIILLAFVFVGPRFLEGSSFVVAIVVIFIARWLYNRWQAGSLAG